MGRAVRIKKLHISVGHEIIVLLLMRHLVVLNTCHSIYIFTEKVCSGIN